MHKLILLLLTVIVLLFAYFSFDGFHFYDDVGYLEKAYTLHHQSFAQSLLNSNEQAHRFGFLVPLAILQLFFPFHELTHIAWVVFCTLAGIYLVYYWFSISYKEVALYASILLGLDYYYLYLCNEVYPDTQTAIFCLLAAFLAWKQSPKLVHAFLFVSCIFIALLCKLTAIFILPFFIFRCFQIFFTNSFRFWLHSLLISFVFLGCYLAVYHHYTGNFLFRFQLVEANRYADALSYLSLIHI